MFAAWRIGILLMLGLFTGTSAGAEAFIADSCASRLNFQFFQDDPVGFAYCVPWDYCDECLESSTRQAMGCGCGQGRTLRGHFGHGQEIIGNFIDLTIPRSPLPFPLLGDWSKIVKSSCHSRWVPARFSQK